MLNETIKKELLKKVDKIEIDVTSLDSYEWDKNPYCVESALIGTSGCATWDKYEEWEEQIKTMVEYLQADSLNEYVTLSDAEQEIDEKDLSLTNQAINWLNSLIY